MNTTVMFGEAVASPSVMPLQDALASVMTFHESDASGSVDTAIELSSGGSSVIESSDAMGYDFVVNPYDLRQWKERDEERFDDLAFKHAEGKLSQKEESVLAWMIQARRRDLPGRTAEEILKTAEHDRLMDEIQEVLLKYYAFKRRFFRPDHSAH